MNNNQKKILLAILIILNLLYFFGPRYKIVFLDSKKENYIKTYRWSPLYKNVSAPGHIIWIPTLSILIPTIILGPLFIYILRDKNK